jgi:hypothetical protein
MMLSTIAGQCVFYVCPFLLGGAGGVCYALYNRFRLRNKIRRRAGALWDLFFWLVMLVAVYAYLLLTVHGEFRLSVAFVLFLGAFASTRIKK